MSDDPAAVDESAAEPTDVDDSNVAETAGTEPFEDDSQADHSAAESADDTSMDSERVDSLIERIAAHDEELAAVADELGDWINTLEAKISDKEAAINERDVRIDALETEIDDKDEEINDLSEKLRRSKADFQNYKKRTKKNQEKMKARATEDLVVRFTDVRENLVRALEQDEDANIRPGVESTLESFDDVLAAENVSIIRPDPGDEVDPERHEVMLRVDSDQPDDTVAEVYQNGYEMGGKVLQPAQVTISGDEA